MNRDDYEYYDEWLECEEDIDLDVFERNCKIRDYGLDEEDLDEDELELITGI